MTSPIDTRIQSVDLSSIVSKKFEELTVVEAAARRIDELKEKIPTDVEPSRPLGEKELARIKDKSELDAYVKEKLKDAPTAKDVMAIARQYSTIEARFEPRPKSSEHHELDVEFVDHEVGSAPKNARVEYRIGLSGPSREVEVKQKELQIRLNKAFTEFTKVIHTDNPIDIFIGTGEDGKPVIQTLTVHRPILDSESRPTGKYEAVYYDLTHESEFKRLLKDNYAGSPLSEEKLTELVEKEQKKLPAITKELDEASDAIAPKSSGSNYTRDSVGNVNGQHPFAQVGPRVGSVLSDDLFMKHTMSKVLSNPKYGMVNKDGTLNAHGVRALKEMGAASRLVREEKKSLKEQLISLRLESEKLKTDPNKDRNTPEVKKRLEELEKEMQSLQKRIDELNQVSEFAVSWMILQLNRPIVLVKAGNPLPEMTLREALQMDPSQYDHIRENGKDTPMNPIDLRQKFASETSMDFEKLILEKNRSWTQVAPHESSRLWSTQKGLSHQESGVGFELGSMFFYQGIGSNDPSFRIRNQIRHEELGYRLEKEIPGVNWLVRAAKEIVDAAEAGKDTVDLQGIRKGLRTHDTILTNVKKVKIEKMKPSEAIDALRPLGMVTDDRSWLRRKLSRN